MDDTDKKILTAIQTDLPVDERPFDVLAGQLGLETETVVSRVAQLEAEEYIRRIGPIFDSRSLGYISTLVAARVPAEQLKGVADRVSALAGVTHNYERRHAYNLWFTLTSPSLEAQTRTLERLRRETGIRHFYSLPALAVYKIRVKFDLAEDAGGQDAAMPQSRMTPKPLSEEQRKLVRLIQDGIPAIRQPFAGVAAQIGWPVRRVIEQIREWLAVGIIRRFGAVVRHRELGFNANGMAVFSVPDSEADAAGRRLAEQPEVSHCYRRPPLEGFPYNLFAMVHGHSEDEVRKTVAEMASRVGLKEYDVLFSTTEFKKVSMRYFLESQAP
jgi:DNA-binding Lrp family transcriptional regulator